MEYISTYFFAVTCSCIRSMHLILWTLINSQHQSHTITTSKFVLPVKFACLSFCLSVCLSVSRNKHKFQCSHMQLYKIDAFDPKDLKSLHQSHTNSSIKICVYCLWSLLACLSVCLSVRLSVCPSVCLSVCLSVTVCLLLSLGCDSFPVCLPAISAHSRATFCKRLVQKLAYSIPYTYFGTSMMNGSSFCINPIQITASALCLFLCLFPCFPVCLPAGPTWNVYTIPELFGYL